MTMDDIVRVRVFMTSIDTDVDIMHRVF